MSQAPQSSRLRWQYPFETETDIIRKFPLIVQEAITLAESLQPAATVLVGKAQFTKRVFEEKVAASARPFTNSFIVPSVQAASLIADALLREGRAADAFAILNVNLELSKVLMERKPEKYRPEYEGLLRRACQAVSANVSGPGETGELKALTERLEANFIRPLVRTVFYGKSGRFVPSNRPDRTIPDRVSGDTLVGHFETHLLRLLEENRTLVREYVRENMPLLYRLRLSTGSATKRDELKQLLIGEGFEDIVESLTNTGDLISQEDIGRLSAADQEELRRAVVANDLERARTVLADAARALKNDLYKETRRRLDYREPPVPARFESEEVRAQFNKARPLARGQVRARIELALEEMRKAWELQIKSLELREWVAYLLARSGNPPAAEDMLLDLRRRRDGKDTFFTEWNLAVLCYEGQREAEAYQILAPLLDVDDADDDLILAVMALSLRYDDRERFLAIIPRTRSLRYHALAVVVAHELGNDARERELLGELLGQHQARWELPPVEQKLTESTLEQTVNKAIANGLVDQLVSWLKRAIALNKRWVPLYRSLAAVLETEQSEFDAAFAVLMNRFEIVLDQRPVDQGRADEACRELLELCRRGARPDLGKAAYRAAKDGGANETLLVSFGEFAPEASLPEISQPPVEEKKSSLPAPPPSDPRLADRLTWTNAGLSNIRNLASYEREARVIDELLRLVREMNPEESKTALEVMNTMSAIIDGFARSGSDSASESERRDIRRAFHERAANCEARLNALMTSGALPRSLTNLLTPYQSAIKQVVDDIAKQAGIGPDIGVVIRNTYLSLEGDASSVVIEFENKTDRTIYDIAAELTASSPVVQVTGSRDHRLPDLPPQSRHTQGFPLLCRTTDGSLTPAEVEFVLSIQASSEGFANVDLGSRKLALPIKTMQAAIGVPQIPKRFQTTPLRPSESDLFQGREDVMATIASSFYEGTQKTPYFLDGIRRVGKTTVLQFLSASLPENVLPVMVNLERFGLRGPIESGSVLARLCTLVAAAARAERGIEIDVPGGGQFDRAPADAVSNFLSELGRAAPKTTPFVMVDELQLLLHAVARSGSGSDRDTSVLDILRAAIDERQLFAVFTGSTRYDRLSDILEHRLYGSLKGLRVSFLSEASVGKVLRAGLERWAAVPAETTRRVHQLTGGYPWLVQRYGEEIVDLLNREHRSVTTAEDIERITVDAVLADDSVFKYWWPREDLHRAEEEVTERLLQKRDLVRPVPVADFLSELPRRDYAKYQRAIDNLRACEVLDSTRRDVLRFGGEALQRWLELQVVDGRLRIPGGSAQEPTELTGMFVDHENLLKRLERVSEARGVPVPTKREARVEWFSKAFDHLFAEAERRLGGIPSYRVVAAFLDDPDVAEVMPGYTRHDFTPRRPEDVKRANAVDFKIGDEIRRCRENAFEKGKSLTSVILVCGDGDLSHSARALKHDGVSLQIWGGHRATNDIYRDIVGYENIAAVDDLCGL